MYFLCYYLNYAVFPKQNKTFQSFYFPNFRLMISEAMVPNAKTLVQVPSNNGFCVLGFSTSSAVFTAY